MPEKQNDFLKSVDEYENSQQGDKVEIKTKLSPTIKKVFLYVLFFYITPFLMAIFVILWYGSDLGYGVVAVCLFLLASWCLATIGAAIIVLIMGLMKLYKFRNRSKKE